MLHKTSHSIWVVLTSTILMVAGLFMCISNHSNIDTRGLQDEEYAACSTYTTRDEENEDHSGGTIHSYSDITLHVGLLGSTPHVPQTMPAKRTTTPRSFHLTYPPHPHNFSFPSDAALQHNFSVHSTRNVPSKSIRACDYYVFALRKILI